MQKILINKYENKDFICSKHGKYNAIKFLGWDEWSKCPKCLEDDKNKKIQDEKQKIFYSQCMRLGIGKRFLYKNFDDFYCDTKDAKIILSQAEDYIKNININFENGRSIIILGNSGAGKSLMASILLKNILKRKYTGAIFQAWEILERIDYYWKSEDTKTKYRALKDYDEYDFLIIDELDKTILNDTKSSFFNLIDFRYKNLKPTIIIANYTPNEFKNLPYYIRRRLNENGGLYWLFNWKPFGGNANG